MTVIPTEQTDRAPVRHIGIPYKQFRTETPFDVIVVGSGIGGMATAALLAKAAGRRVLVLERHYTAGGCTHVFHRPGFEWDVGLHYVGQVHTAGTPERAFFEYLTEGRLSWNAMPEVYDRIVVDRLRFDYVSGKERLREKLVGAFPRERETIDRYFGAIEQCTRRLPLFFAEKTLPAGLPGLVRRGLRAPFLKLARRTTGEVLDDLGASPELRAVLSARWGDYGLPPGQSSFGMHAIVVAHYFNGAAYPVGGASRIATSLLPTIERAGGAVVVSAEVDGILLDGARAIGVRMKDGRELRAAAVVSDAGIRTTMERLLPKEGPAAEVVDRTSSIPPSLAHLCLYVGWEPRAGTERPGPANLWIHPGLDFDRNWSAFAADPDAPFPFLFISFPSAKDPSFVERHPGHETIEVISPAPYAWFSQWADSRWKRRGQEYDTFKRKLADRLVSALYQHVPQVAGAMTIAELSTPLSTRHFANAAHGEIYGLAHTPARFESRDLQPRTPIAQLFLTGQDVGTEGIVGALSAAVTTASVMLKRNLHFAIPKAVAA